MDNSSEEVAFVIGEKFSFFSNLKDKIDELQKTQLYVKRSRSIEAAAIKHAPKKQFNEELKYSEIGYSCIRGGKDFKSTSTGERPNQR